MDTFTELVWCGVYGSEIIMCQESCRQTEAGEWRVAYREENSLSLVVYVIIIIIITCDDRNTRR